MQRWILLGLVAGFLLVVGAGAGLWVFRQNRPDQQWVPMPLNPRSTPEEREELAKTVQLLLQEESILRKIVRSSSLQEKWDTSSEDAALEMLKTRMFVRLGEFRDPMSQELFTTLDIGVNGPRKEKMLIGELATKLATEAGKSLGVEQPED
jgi:hypothetical protein